MGPPSMHACVITGPHPARFARRPPPEGEVLSSLLIGSRISRRVSVTSGQSHGATHRLRSLRGARLELGALECFLSRCAGRRADSPAGRVGPTASGRSSSTCMGPGCDRPRWHVCRCSRGTAIFASNGQGPSARPSHILVAVGLPSKRGRWSASAHAVAGTSVYFRDPDGSLMEFISYERQS